MPSPWTSLCNGPRELLLSSAACVITIYFTTLFPTTVEGISCVQCSSLISPDCLRPNLTAIKCQGSSEGAKSCLMYITVIEGHPNTKFIFRHCGSFYADQPICRSSIILDTPARSCYITCNKNGCNNDITIAGIYQRANQTSPTAGRATAAAESAKIDKYMAEFVSVLSEYIQESSTSGAISSHHHRPVITSWLLLVAVLRFCST